MAALLTIEMVNEYLKKYSKTTDTRQLPSPPPEIVNKTTDLDFDNSLPPNWEHWLDIKTGGLCFINRKTLAGSYYSEESSNGGFDDKSNGGFLVVVGCKVCLKYMMVMQEVEACPRCGGILFHFERERCF